MPAGHNRKDRPPDGAYSVAIDVDRVQGDKSANQAPTHSSGGPVDGGRSLQSEINNALRSEANRAEGGSQGRDFPWVIYWL